MRPNEDSDAPRHTVIVSDMHLSDTEPVDPKRPHWKAYKQEQFFFDDDFQRMLEHVGREAEGPVELVLNGDIFDFDNITQLPHDPPSPLRWIYRLRGLASEQWMSLFKVDQIIDDHPIWFEALADFIRAGNHAVFVIGNHDVELYWPAVQERIRAALALPEELSPNLVFCDWFYVSGGDTYVSHGHLYDPYCTQKNPLNPLILVHGRPRVRVPFGNMAERYMLNGMGYFNPHATENFIMSATEYLSFFLKYIVRTQPFLLFTWFWSALATLILTLRDFWRPAMRDPLLVDEKTQGIAERAKATPPMVRKLNALNVPSACTDPIKIAKELWLDRGLLFLLTVYVAFQLVLAVNFVIPISVWWIFLAIALLFPMFLFYSFKVRSGVFVDPLMTENRAQLINRITGAKFVVFGHTHIPVDEHVGPIRYLNGGSWSPAFAEPTCQTRIGTQTFVWLKPAGNRERAPAIFEWPPGGDAPVRHTITGVPAAENTSSAPESSPAG